MQDAHTPQQPVALFGAAGYSGLELVKLLSRHPRVRLACAASDSHAGRPVEQLTGQPAGGLAFVSTAAARELAAGCGAALLAVPPGPAKELAEPLRAAGVRVVDLSHAYRASASAAYGLTSLFPAEIAAAGLVANPGCYATAVITAAAPLVRHGLLGGELFVSAGSGVTGAGRTADEAMSLGEMYGEVRAYKVLRHQHVPEIEMALGRVAARAGGADGAGGAEGRPLPPIVPPIVPPVVLTTHLLPVARGIFATLTARLSRPLSSAELTARYRADYADDPTVDIAETPEDVSLRRVVGTNACRIGIASDDRGMVVVTAALDNLIKGAAGQAVENLNTMLGLPRTTGLEHLARHA
ncbi:MAG TPA: N-acetyl-gamma-glutamyl-phosphate reductase [Kofleriaceae bacterium]|nr:N-acetyl-gamma-glutamyl-phosphate reductase [Kofleriaceae bacterium]